jgi:isopenicillin N synthase-like dioxygenase
VARQLTNGHYRSAKHRVVTVSAAPRYSTAFFT